MLVRLHGMLVFGALAALLRAAPQARLSPASRQTDVPRTRLPSLGALRAASLNQRHALADLFYLQAVALWGQKSANPERYRDLVPLLERAIGLDPQFEAAYLLVGTALTPQSLHRARSLSLLAQGTRLRPDSWQLLMMQGLALYDLEHDGLGASRAMAQAATLPGAPPFLPFVAARLGAQAHDPRLGLALLQTLRAAESEPARVQAYTERIELLQLELLVPELQAAVDAYRAQKGHPPESFEAVVRAGLLPELPRDPSGGTLALTPEGRVEASHGHLLLSHPNPAEGETP